MLVFTNRNKAQLGGVFGDDPRCRVFMKEELWLPGEFADIIEEFARATRVGDRKEPTS